MLTVTGNADFPGQSTAACSTTAPLVTCQFNPPTLTIGTTATQVSVTITWQRRTGAGGDPVSTYTIVATLAPTT